MVASLIEAFGSIHDNLNQDSLCSLNNDLLFFTKKGNEGKTCEINGNKITCSFDAVNNFKVSGDGKKIKNSELITGNNTVLTCSEPWDNYYNCSGNIVGECHGGNWNPCSIGFDPSNIVYGCGSNVNSFIYNQNTNSCERVSGNAGNYNSLEDCKEKAVKKYNFLTNWKCTYVGGEINRPVQHDNPIYTSLQDCKKDSQKICNGLTSADPNVRKKSIKLLIDTADGKKLPQINCGCSISS